MQIFIRLSTGKTISMDVTKQTILADVLQYANDYHSAEQSEFIPYTNLLLLKGYHDESNLSVEKNKILNLDISLISLYHNKVIKEVLFMAC
jgi:hypothetical protein